MFITAVGKAAGGECIVPRPTQLRQVSLRPSIKCFKPIGIPMSELEILSLQLDELEAIRLTDREGLYQEEAATRMGVSRVTFGRILREAHEKVAEALLEGKALVIGEGPVRFAPGLRGVCAVHEGPRRRGRACRCGRDPEESVRQGEEK
jgi:predicted DNA-binding protein (UPF0251 family)